MNSQIWVYRTSIWHKLECLLGFLRCPQLPERSSRTEINGPRSTDRDQRTVHVNSMTRLERRWRSRDLWKGWASLDELDGFYCFVGIPTFWISHLATGINAKMLVLAHEKCCWQYFHVGDRFELLIKREKYHQNLKLTSGICLLQQCDQDILRAIYLVSYVT